MTMHVKRILLIVLCAVGIPVILLGSLLFGGRAAPQRKLQLTEIMNHNVSCLRDADGKYYDWVELTNRANMALSLKGLSLTDDPGESQAFVFGDTVLEAGGCVVIPLTGNASEARVGYAPFGLKTSGDTVYLYDGDTLLDSLTVGRCPENVSYGIVDGQAVFMASPTPNAVNRGPHAATTEALREVCYTGVMISEVCAVSRAGDAVSPTDWVELYNTTAQAINLEGYTLTEDVTAAGFTFPAVTIQAGEHLVIPCDSDATDTLCAPFSLSPYGETLTLLTPDGIVCDRLESGKQRHGITSGRNGTNRSERVYFEDPTPAAENGTGIKGYAATPTADRAGGYTEKDAGVMLTVPHGTRVYYTTDGREPTEQDTPYTSGAVLTMTETTVLRARAYRDGYLPSDVMEHTYLVTEPHAVPVISVAGDPQALFGASGAFTNFRDESKEVAVHTVYFEKDGTQAVSFDSLLRIAGGLSRYNVQKAFSLNLNQTVGQTTVRYPFFENAETEEFGNLLLRPSGSDWNSAKLRDELVAAALDGQDEFVMQAVQPVALYINGAYHGLYYLREKRNEKFIAAETGIPEKRVEIAKTPAQYEKYLPMNADMKALITYARTHDLRDDEHYRYVTARINEQSLMRYYAVQTWFGNGDVINNTAYYRDTQNGEWNWIVFDMDWACTSFYAQSEFIKQLYEGSGQNTYRNYYDPLMTALLQNEQFSREFLKIYKELMRGALSSERLLPILEDLAAEIEGEIPRQYARYGAPSPAKWNTQINYIRTFIRGRESVMTRQLRGVFGLSEDEWNAL